MKRRSWLQGAGALLGGLVVAGPRLRADTALGLKVIVHPGVPGKSIGKGLLGDIFLRRTLKWGDGATIQPVDQISNAPARAAFNRGVLGLSSLDVQQYWVSQMSKGRTPPPVKKTEAEVIAFVATNAGAIGYVSETMAIPDTVRTLQIE